MRCLPAGRRTPRDPGDGAAPLPLSPSVDDMPSFIPAWLTTARRFSVPLDAVEPRQRSGSLQLQLLDAGNAAETLHRTAHGEPTAHPLAERVFQALGDSRQFNSAERRSVRAAVRNFVDNTLEKRLLSLAEDLGPEVCAWLFSDTQAPWAFVTACIRNTLSHGLTAPHGVHEDTGALIGALHVTEAVITLRLLIEAGLPTGSRLTAQLERHHGMRSLAKQRIADWPALAHRIDPQRWHGPVPDLPADDKRSADPEPA